MRKLERAYPNRTWWSTREIAEKMGKSMQGTHAHLHNLRFKTVVEARMVSIPGFGVTHLRFFIDKDGRRWKLVTQPVAEPNLDERVELSTEAWMVLNVLSQEWVQAMVSAVIGLRDDEITGAVIEINQALGREV